MKTYKLYTERYVTDVTTIEVPDNIDVEKYVEDNGVDDIINIEGSIVHTTDYDVYSTDSEWYRLEDEDGDVIDEY